MSNFLHERALGNRVSLIKEAIASLDEISSYWSGVLSGERDLGADIPMVGEEARRLISGQSVRDGVYGDKYMDPDLVSAGKKRPKQRAHSVAMERSRGAVEDIEGDRALPAAFLEGAETRAETDLPTGRPKIEDLRGPAAAKYNLMERARKQRHPLRGTPTEAIKGPESTEMFNLIQKLRGERAVQDLGQ